MKYKKKEILCPSCIKMTTNKKCLSCGAEFCGLIVKPFKRKECSIILPKIREVIPNSIPKDNR